MNAREFGLRCEQMVADYLRGRGYLIAARNYHSRGGEIDIIAENETYIVFVEVKARSAGARYLPQEAVDARKRQRIFETAQRYLLQSHSRLQPRFDVAAVTASPGEHGTVFRLEYFANAFQPDEDGARY